MKKRIKSTFCIGILVISMVVMAIISLSGCDSEATTYTWESTDSTSEATITQGSTESTSQNTSQGSEDSGKQDAEAIDSQTGNSAPANSDSDDSGPKVVVHICGAVAKPGVYRLAEGSRIYDLIVVAGGLLETADERYLNQAEILQDGQQVVVYTREEIQDGTFSKTSLGHQEGDRKKVNINTADEATLMTLSGIGESRARAIIAYREEHGGFQSIEAIMEIEGIKEKLFEKIKDEIEV